MKATRVVIVFSILLGLGTRTSLAQSGIKEDTLDAHVALADRIVRATVADVSFERVDDRPTKGWIRTIVTLTVVETIKGSPAESLTFGLGGYHVDQRYQGWKEAGTESLWFLRRNAVYGKKENFGEDEIYARFPLNLQYRISLGPAVASEKLYGPSRPPVFTVMLDVLTDPGAILKATSASAAYPSDRERAQALMPPGDFPPESHPVSVPRAIMERSGRVGDYNYLGMPIDRRLETLARRMITRPGDLLDLDAKARRDSERRFEEAQLRAEGAKALRYFQSDENIALLKPLLNDSAIMHVTKPIEGQAVEKFREYFVRKEAVATLRCWGHNCDEILIRERETSP